MELRNIILITIAGFTLSYARYGKLRNGYDVMQLHARIWKGLLNGLYIALWMRLHWLSLGLIKPRPEIQT